MANGNHKREEKCPEKHVSGQATEKLSALPHALSVDQFMSEVCTHPELGLTAADAEMRLQKFGPNEIDQGEGVSATKILVRQIANAMILVMLATLSFEIQRF
jgi:P-type Na+/K+ transporter